MINPEMTVHQRVVQALNGLPRIEAHAGQDTPEGVQADLTNLRAAVRELQAAVVLLADELDARAASAAKGAADE